MRVTRVTGFMSWDEPKTNYSYTIRGQHKTAYTMPHLGYRVEVELMPSQAQAWEQATGSSGKARKALFTQRVPEIENYVSGTFTFVLYASSKIRDPKQAGEVVLQLVEKAYSNAGF